ncbi:MAG: CTP synthase (glutamine hydrolyzing), partial [Thermoplasmata archaeon]|nr:CTP synthase (glutamine hydrolyzing) [Thermoplasmata archaeon]
GGTVGDIESMPFLEAVRQLSMDVGKENCVFIHTTLVPVMGAVGEQKTKPTQHSVRELRALGIHPSVIIARGDSHLLDEIKRKISLFCDVPFEAVISAPDTDTIYQVPIIFERQKLTDYIMEKLSLKTKRKDLKSWKMFLNNVRKPTKEISIAIVGKYTKLMDSYLSHIEALSHAGAFRKTKVNIIWVESDDLENGSGVKSLRRSSGILVPGGFGHRGAEGKISAIKFARENGVPFLGVCFGFQLAVIEFSRNRLGLERANSAEFDPKTPDPVIDLLPEQRKVKEMGATMRLGAHEVTVKKGSRAHELYKSTKISERHRHRYEVSLKYISRIEKAGMIFTGKSLDSRRMEILEMPDHLYFMASQFHPEFKSRPGRPHPLF